MSQLQIYNTLTGNKDIFKPIHDGHIGMYVCGPTLYSEQHIGNIRTQLSFDMIRRYLEYLNYSVKYVRNITDCGHVTNSEGDEVDRIGVAARKEQLQSLEIVYKYNIKFQEALRTYNILPPSVETTATAHIQEQIEIIEQIIANGFGYAVNGSVYFDVKKYIETNPYGVISGRKVDELLEETRELQGQDEKRFFADFGLWKKANPEDMQIWRSPWGDGNPGWHIECTAMSTKYLGSEFDIHGGGSDLKFPHHENEVAQSCGAGMKNPARYWMHAGMLNVNGKKMSKSFGTTFYPLEIIEGKTNLFSKPFSAPVVRFFMMMSHYRSELDITNDGLIAAEKGYERLTDAFSKISKLNISKSSTSSDSLQSIADSCQDSMNDDFNTSKLIADLFELATTINKIENGELIANEEDIRSIQKLVDGYFVQVLGIEMKNSGQDNSEAMGHLMELIIDIRKDSREKKDFATSDKIRDYLTQAGITLRDGKEGTSWKL